MSIDPTEAKALLEAAKSAQGGVRRTLGAWGAGYHFLVWGLVCLVCFGLTHFAPRLPIFVVAIAWILFEAAGVVASNLVGRRMRSRVTGPADARIAYLWIIFTAFGLAIALLIRPADGRDISAFVALMTALCMCVMGLWINLALLWMGAAIAALTILGATLFRDWYYLWMSLAVGGSMTAAGAALVALGRRRGRA